MFINMQGQANSSESSATPPNFDEPYMCSRCSKIFHSSHAYGGHQNAHRREKLREKILQILERHAQRNQTQTPTPLGAILPSDNDPNISYWVAMLAKTGSSHGPMSVCQPGLGFGPENGQGFIPGHQNCTDSGAKDEYEALSRAHDHVNLNYHPNLMPENKKMMALELSLGQESDAAARAGQGACLGLGESSNAADEDAYADEINFMKKLDLTLKL